MVGRVCGTLDNDWRIGHHPSNPLTRRLLSLKQALLLESNLSGGSMLVTLSNCCAIAILSAVHSKSMQIRNRHFYENVD